jgi:hypothetical protein
MRNYYEEAHVMESGRVFTPVDLGEYRLIRFPPKLTPLDMHTAVCPFCRAGYGIGCARADELRTEGEEPTQA